MMACKTGEKIKNKKGRGFAEKEIRRGGKLREKEYFYGERVERN